jgi:hypothetical protein
MDFTRSHELVVHNARNKPRLHQYFSRARATAVEKASFNGTAQVENLTGVYSSQLSLKEFRGRAFALGLVAKVMCG